MRCLKKQGGTSGSSGAGAGSCAHVSPFSVATQDSQPKGIAFSKSATKMFVVGNDNDADGKVHEYTLTGAYCIGSASFVDSFSTANSGASENNPTGIVFSKSGDKMFIVGATNNNQGKVSEYTLTTAWDVSTASFVDSLFTNSVRDLIVMLHLVLRSASPEIKCLSWFQKLLMP